MLVSTDSVIASLPSRRSNDGKYLLMIQNFRNMHYSLLFLLPVQSTRDMHEAACFGHHQSWGLGDLQVADLALEPFRGELGMFHRKDPAEAATFLRLRQFHDLRPADVCQQGARLAVDLHAAQSMAGGVIGQRPIPARAEVDDAQLVYKILGEFVDAVSH